MFENTDSNQLNGGTSAQPNADGSQSAGVSGSSQQAQLQATLETLTRRLEEIDSRTKTLQGDKDRGVKKAMNEVEELKRKFAEVEKLKQRGLAEDDAFEELQLREMIRNLQSPSSASPSTQSQPAGTGNGMAVALAKTLSDYGLSENDPDVAAELSSKTFANPLEMENFALKVAFKRSQRPAPDLSAVTSAVGAPPAIKDPKGMKADYIKEITSARGNKAQIKAIQAKYRNAGFDPGSVHFGV